MGQRKLFTAQVSVTGSAAVVTGLSAIDPGSASAENQATAATGTIEHAYVHSVVGGTINVGCASINPTGPVVTNPSATADTSIGVRCTGY
ncbi:MAG: hypothetical protein ACRD2H_09710 [Terriglobales bacterium]